MKTPKNKYFQQSTSNKQKYFKGRNFGGFRV